MITVPKAAIFKAVESGKPVVIVEYRGSRADKMSWSDRATGRAMTAPFLEHHVETDEGVALKVRERVAETFDPETFKSEFKKGQKVALWVTAWIVERGNTEVRGFLQGFNENGTPEQPASQPLSRSAAR